MDERNRHIGRWLTIALVILAGIATGVFIAMRPLATTRVPRAPTRPSEASKHDPIPPIETEPPTVAAEPPYLEGNGSTTVPATYPVKVNQRSGIYHLLGDLAYDRTVASRFYRTSEAAESDGFRHARR